MTTNPGSPVPSRNRAAVLAIGSELLSGQTVNSNASWISTRLVDLGFEVMRHHVVDDIDIDIRSGLDSLAPVADILIVTGGLGPTSDDLTRQAVATWCGLPLKYDDASWQHIVEIFARMQRSVPETNKQQCYFPESARVLTNRVGTANAFTVQAKSKEVWVLPGPPHEVSAIWEDHVHPTLRDRVPEPSRRRLLSWRTIGRGESHLAEHIGPLLKDRKNLEIAYRAHAPFVELKIRYLPADQASTHELAEKITAALAPWLYEINDQDVPSELLERMSRFKSIEVWDGVTQGHLAELLAPALRKSGARGLPFGLTTTFDDTESPKASIQRWLSQETDSELALAIAGLGRDHRWAIGMRIDDEISVVEHSLPYKGEHMLQRNLKAISSLAAKAWLTLLSGSLH